MAKGKKSSGKHYISNGERPNVNKDFLKDVRKKYLSTRFARVLNQVKAWKRGKNVMLTIENPNPNETNKRFIRVSAKHVWGNGAYTYKMNSKVVLED